MGSGNACVQVKWWKNGQCGAFSLSTHRLGMGDGGKKGHYYITPYYTELQNTKSLPEMKLSFQVVQISLCAISF